MPKEDDGQIGDLIAKPHAHDVLCGRGGLTNQHSGNEWFRRLVRSNRSLYRSCPKHTKLLVAKAIVQAVQQQEPSGRFLELAKKDSGLWKQITYKRTVDKTSQALREKETPAPKDGGPAPVADTSGRVEAEAAVAAAVAAAREGGKGSKKENDLSDLTQATLKQAGLISDGGGAQQQQPQTMNLPGMGMPQQPGMDFNKKRKQAAPQSNDFVKPSWWNRGTPMMNNSSDPNKKMKMEQQEDPAPLPPEPLEVRQSSLFRFLNNTSIFGRSNQQQNPMQQSSSMFGFSSGNNNNNNSVGQNPGDMISAEAAHFEQRRRNSQRLSLLMQQQRQLQQSMAESNNFMLDPLPLNMNGGGTNQQQGNLNSNSNNNRLSFSQQGQMQREMMQHQQEQEQGGVPFGGLNNHRNSYNNYPLGAMEEMPVTGLFPSGMASNMPVYPPVAAALGGDDDAPLPVRHLTTQVSDWLTTFFPLGKDGSPDESQQLPPPPPTGDDLERSISSTLFNLVRSPSQFLTNLKSGVTSMFGETPSPPVPQGFNNPNSSGHINNVAAGGGGAMMGMGSNEAKQSSLLDDYEESELETKLRSVSSR